MAAVVAVVSGESMAPSLRDGDRVVVRRSGGRPTGSVVVAQHPDRQGLLIVKRLAGGPGDVVYGAPLGPGEYWLASDNLLVAPDDSRSFGPVRAAQIRGRLLMCVRWPRRRQRGGSLPMIRS